MLWPLYSLESEFLKRWWPYSYDYAIWSNKKWCFYFGLSISTLFSSSAFNCSFLFWSQNSLWVIWCVIWLTWPHDSSLRKNFNDVIDEFGSSSLPHLQYLVQTPMKLDWLLILTYESLKWLIVGSFSSSSQKFISRSNPDFVSFQKFLLIANQWSRIGSHARIISCDPTHAIKDHSECVFHTAQFNLCSLLVPDKLY